MTFNLQCKVHLRACALLTYIPNHSDKYCTITLDRKKSSLKNFAHFVAGCLF